MGFLNFNIRRKSMKKLSVLIVTVLVISLSKTAWSEEITILDQVGRTVVIQQPVKRVVTTFIPATIFSLCAGLKDNLVGASTKDGTSSIYEALIDENDPPILVGNRTVGLNLETIASLRPDLIIMYGQKDGVRIADRLTEMGFPAIVILPESLEDMKKTLELIGVAAGNKAHTDKVVAAMSATEQKIAARVKGKPTPKVYYATSNLLRSVSGDLLQNEMIALAGGKNVSEDTKGFFISVSREQLVAWNPEIIIGSDRLPPKEITRIDSPEFYNLAARNNKQIYRVPTDTYWDFPSPLAIAGVLWMSNKIHPEVYQQIDVQQEINSLYDTIFGENFSIEHPTVVGKEQ